MSETATVTLYTKPWCSFCMRAKQLLDSKETGYVEISLDSQPEKREEMIQRSGRRTVPQIWVGETHVGGCDELFALERAGQLDDMLAKGSSAG